MVTTFDDGMWSTPRRWAPWSGRLFSRVLFGIYLGALLWARLWLRDPRLRAFFS